MRPETVRTVLSIFAALCVACATVSAARPSDKAKGDKVTLKELTRAKGAALHCLTRPTSSNPNAAGRALTTPFPAP
jgi:hypothetical protein